MPNIIESINAIISDLTDPKVQLKDTLLKVKVLAYKIKNEKLKTWVEYELNGYINATVPPYRKIPTAVYGNLIQDRRFGSAMSRTNQVLPTEYLEPDIRETLRMVSINSTVSELEHMVDKGGAFQVNIPHYIFSAFNRIFDNSWVVESAWQKISITSISGILSAIKSALLTFLLELTNEIGENDNLDFNIDKNNIDNLFDRTLGTLNGEIINISIGHGNIQTNSSGENANVNVAKGTDVTQNINPDLNIELNELIKILIRDLNNLSLAENDIEDVNLEINRIQTQLQRKEPKYSIINEALKVVNGVLIGVAGNTMTPVIVEKIQWVIAQIK